MAAKGVLRTLARNPGFGGADTAFFCPGCKEVHALSVTPGPGGSGPVWGFNGNYDRPTFTPSVLVEGYSIITDQQFRCHSFITDGVIRFLDDCTHELKGKTAPLQPFGDEVL